MKTLSDLIAEAKKNCIEQYEGPGVCLKPSYLRARHFYHRLLIAAGKDFPFAEPLPKPKMVKK